ncbi:MAG: FAD:protein FMN transferase [Flavobacteriaceae bacterium]
MTDLLKLPRAIFIVALAMLVTVCQPEREWIRNVAAGPALGTSYSIIYLTKDPLDLQSDIDSVFSVINQSMSTYIPDSDISRINNGDTTIQVDHMFREVFDLSKEVHDETDGYFDPTVGVLVNAWGFGPGKGIELDSSRIDSLLDYVGFNKVRITNQNRVQKKLPQIRFDFNAVAKGYAIDRLGRMLEKYDIDHYLVEVGGELLAKGENRQKKKRWVVGIDDPEVTEGHRLKRTIFLKDMAMASSGNYRKFRVDTITGERYVHTIDPKTGFTKNSKVLSTSVITSNCARADAYATAFMAMDLEESMEILNEVKDLEVYIIYIDKEGNTLEYITEGFDALLVL